MSIVNALTVDVEDYFQVSAFEDDIDRHAWDGYESRVVGNTQRLLDLLEQHGVRATFFVLGWVAHRFPKLVRDVHEAGHEIGSHSYWHRLVYRLSPEEFREDLRLSRAVIEDAIGERVTSYRAPSFSITAGSLWALRVLVEEGFRVDSSIFPIRHDRYGIPGALRHVHSIDTPSGPIWEFPASVARFGWLNVPVSGGGYFRLYPFSWTHFCLRRINRSADQPFVFYLHPWEHDTGQPRLKAGSRLSRFRHYVNLSGTQRKLEALLGTFRFGRLCDVVATAATTAASTSSEA